MSVTRGYGYVPAETSGDYLRFPKEGGTLRMRLVSEPIIFTEETNFDGKPGTKVSAAWIVLYRDKVAKETVCRHFKAGMKVYGAIRELAMDSEEWGDPLGYDIKITRTGQKLDTKYTVVPCAKTPLTAEEEQMVDDAAFDLEALYTGSSGQDGHSNDPGDPPDPFADED